jgi:hypothetical protein
VAEDDATTGALFDNEAARSYVAERQRIKQIQQGHAAHEVVPTEAAE